LIGFGADSLIESLAGFVVIWLFTGSRLRSPTAERHAQQLIAGASSFSRLTSPVRRRFPEEDRVRGPVCTSANFRHSSSLSRSRRLEEVVHEIVLTPLRLLAFEDEIASRCVR
jgi:hypothetical protein